MNAIEVENLRRTYRARIGLFSGKFKEVVAVEDISFAVRRGELFGLLGPNGAGKTTTIKILITLLIPDSGRARILGKDVVREAREIRARIGFVLGGERGLYWRLNAYDNLRYFANLYHLDPDVTKRRIPELLELVGLDGRGDEKIEGYSRGMKQRLHIARALLHDPEVIFLDEPTIGLDPVGARQLRTLVNDLQGQGKTILLTTHYMFEADALCQRIAVINHGKLIALDEPTTLKRYVRDLSVIEIELYGIPAEVIPIVRTMHEVENVSVDNLEHRHVLRIQSGNGAETVAPVVRLLEGQGVSVGRVSVREPTLEDAYVRLIGGESNGQVLARHEKSLSAAV